MESNFIVSARKYRPQTFDSVVGQKSITTTLKNAIKTNQLAHAYLFCGPRGVGKTTCARIFAKTINCQNLTDEVEACNECDSCSSFNTSRSMNIHELDAASNNSVDDIRKLIDQVRVPPQIGKYSVYIIDEVHMLSTQAFNAFLKTLEEPPEHAIFILATTEKHKILPTILSRCQIFDFNRIQVNDIVEHLLHISEQEEIKSEPDALNILAQKADGALRDALSFFDQIASYSDKHITYQKVIQSLNVLDYDYYFQLTDSFIAGDYTKSLMIFNDILNNGFDSHNFIIGISSHFRDLLVTKDKQTIELLEVGHKIKERYLEQSQKSSVQFLLKALQIVSKTDVEHKFSKNRRLHTELMLLNLSQITNQIQQRNISVKQNVNQSVTEEKKAEYEKKEPKIEHKNTTKKEVEIKKPEDKTVSNTKLPSVNSILNGKEKIPKEKSKQENEKEETNFTGTEKVNEDTVIAAWRKYGNTFLATQPRLLTIFSDYPLKLVNQTIKLTVSNEDQKERIIKLKAKIL
ncbi:MAG: DNA polymerase III subunit gamma/tau, partial [Bacteroidota bacterium]|nr:DNA polymerase III subunit gamma/tau [Bacteroidota bacterium]